MKKIASSLIGCNVNNCVKMMNQSVVLLLEMSAVIWFLMTENVSVP